jgi:peptide/nickel transport system permease protein
VSTLGFTGAILAGCLAGSVVLAIMAVLWEQRPWVRSGLGLAATVAGCVPFVLLVIGFGASAGLAALAGILIAGGSFYPPFRALFQDIWRSSSLRGAESRGLKTSTRLFRYALPGAFLGWLDHAGALLPFLVVCSLVAEPPCGIAGLGDLAVQAIGAVDLDILRSVMLTGAALLLAAGMIVNGLRIVFDPHLR